MERAEIPPGLWVIIAATKQGLEACPVLNTPYFCWCYPEIEVGGLGNQSTRRPLEVDDDIMRGG